MTEKSLGLALALAVAFAGTAAALPQGAPAAPSPTATLQEPPLPRGQLVEKVACREHAEHSYALYLPSFYKPDRGWPIVYAFDARGRAVTAAETFKAAAETYGWLVASAYGTSSDGPVEPNFAAFRAIWADTHARLAVDDKRVYAAGFSGTVRFACILALTAPGSIAGVIGASAGFPFKAPPKADNPFPFFGTVGDRDFNYYEMMDLDQKLDALHLPYRIEMFDGNHQWPPAELAAQAVGWMELQAMKAGTREKAPALIESLWAADRERAQALESAGKLWDARRLWAAMAVGAKGLRDTREAEQRAAAIAASEGFEKQARAWRQRLDRDTALLSAAPAILAQTNPGNTPATVAQIAAQLKIPELRARAAAADPEESLAAKRVLNTILVQTTYYLPRSFLEKKEYDRAAFMLSLAAEIRPEDPQVWVEIAAAHAHKGRSGRRKALEALHRAVDKGLADPAALEDEPAFADLRQERDFRQLLAQVAQRKAGGKG